MRHVNRARSWNPSLYLLFKRVTSNHFSSRRRETRNFIIYMIYRSNIAVKSKWFLIFYSCSLMNCEVCEMVKGRLVEARFDWGFKYPISSHSESLRLQLAVCSFISEQFDCLMFIRGCHRFYFIY